MKYLVEKDKKRRQCFNKKENFWVLYRSLIHNQSLDLMFRKFLYEGFFNFPLNSSKTRLKNRCILSFRAGSVLKKFRISRHVFRELSLNGKISGIVKSSW